MVQPFTVMVLADTDPGPPVVVELDTEPPPACTCTPVLPAELLLEMLPAPLLLPAAAPAALMLQSACFSTETVHRSPDDVLPVLTIVSACAVPPIAALSAIAAVNVHARVIVTPRVWKEERGTAVAIPRQHSLLVFPHFIASAAVMVLVMALAVFHARGACR